MGLVIVQVLVVWYCPHWQFNEERRDQSSGKDIMYVGSKDMKKGYGIYDNSSGRWTSFTN